MGSCQTRDSKAEPENGPREGGEQTLVQLGASILAAPTRGNACSGPQGYLGPGVLGCSLAEIYRAVVLMEAPRRGRRDRIVEVWKQDRIGAAQRGKHPIVLAQMRRGFAVIGDTQFLPGYCLLLGVPQMNHRSDLPFDRCGDFLL